MVARALSGTEAAEWARYAHRVTPLPGKAVVPPPDGGADVAVGSRDTMAQRLSRPVPMRPVAPVQAPPLGVGGQPSGIDAASWQRFRRSQLATARKLDLHGLTAQQAFHALRTFLRAAHSDRIRCVEIVTGRGDGEHGGVLRREFAFWLNLPDIRPLILAAVHPHTSNALHAHATNPGSVRLLLRRPRR